MNSFTKQLGRALYELDRLGFYATGTVHARRLLPMRVRLSKMLTATGYEFSDHPPRLRKRRT